jgi:hypothetical protein
MSSYLSVQHPIDPVRAGFDFWVWRLLRRFIVDHLRTAAEAQGEDRFAEIAARLEREQLSADDARFLPQAVPAGRHNLTTTRGLFHALAEWNKQAGAEVQQHWYMPAIRPEWSDVPLSRPVFAGLIGRERVQARLPESMELVPPYEIIWLEGEDEERAPESVADTHYGEYIEFAPAIWDWLFARRLTLLCLNGIGEWPSVANSPLLIGEGWQMIPRPF